MNKQQYDLLNRLIRRIERLDRELEQVWTAVARLLLKHERDLVENRLREMFTQEQIGKVRLMQNRAEVIKDRYHAQRWVFYAVHKKLGYHDGLMIKRVTDKLRDYYWENYNAAHGDV